MVEKKKSIDGLVGGPGQKPNPMDPIAAELKQAREAKGLSLSDLHRLTGLSRTALHQYEAGTRKPGARELIRLCEVLEVSPNRILFGRETPFRVPHQGVLSALAVMARSEPGRAAGLMIPILPMAASAIGNEAVMSIATLADEILRQRDPVVYRALSAMVETLHDLPVEDIVNSTPEQQKAFVEHLSQVVRAKAETESPS